MPSVETIDLGRMVPAVVVHVPHEGAAFSVFEISQTKQATIPIDCENAVTFDTEDTPAALQLPPETGHLRQ